MKHSMTRRDFMKAAALATGAVSTGVAASPADIYQIGCYTRPFDQLDYRAALDGIAEAGYKFAGIMTAKGKTWAMISTATEVEEAARIGDEVRQRKLLALSVYGDFSVKETVEQGIQGLRRLVDNCHACGSPGLLLGGTTDLKLVDNYFKVVAECCDYAASKKVALSIKPHGGQNATGPQCRKWIEQVNKPNFRLWYDPGNIFYYSDGQLDPAQDSLTVNGLVAGVSIKDFKPPKEVLVTPGTGKVDFPKVMSQFRRGGFTKGPLIVECVSRGEGLNPIEEARKARLFLENLLKDLA